MTSLEGAWRGRGPTRPDQKQPAGEHTLTMRREQRSMQGSRVRGCVPEAGSFYVGYDFVYRMGKPLLVWSVSTFPTN